MAGIPSKSWAFNQSTTKIQRSSKPLFTIKVSIQRVSLPSAPLCCFFVFFSFTEEEICLPRMQKSNVEVISRVSYSFGKIRFGKQEPIYRKSYSAGSREWKTEMEKWKKPHTIWFTRTHFHKSALTRVKTVVLQSRRVPLSRFTNLPSYELWSSALRNKNAVQIF